MRKWMLLAASIICLDLLLITYVWVFEWSNKTETNLKSNKAVQVKSPKLNAEIPTKLILLGDIMLGRTVNSISLERNNPKYPFEKVYEKLKNADVVFGNLESPIIDDCPIIESGYTFCADQKMVEALTFSGIDVVSLANNHSHNFGEEGLRETKDILKKNGILWVDGTNLEIIEKNGIKFGFLGFDFFTKSPKESDWELIKESNSKVDVLVVGVHWGVEYKNMANDDQRLWAKEMVVRGADIISGHHPHWVQDREVINDRYVYYSLGNFVFDQMWSEETKKGLAVEIRFNKDKVIAEELLPIYMSEWAQPEWVNAE